MILYFSGNGNSKAIAAALSQALNEQTIISLKDDILLHPDRLANYQLGADERVVWVFPVYSWGVPPVVAKFIKNCGLKSTPGNDHFLVLTCGDDCGLTSRQWQNLITKRGWIPKGKFSVFMPNSYVLMKGFDVDSPEIEKEKIKAAHEMIPDIALKISQGSEDDTTFHGKFAWIKSHIIYPWFIRYAMSPKPFRATDQCIGCGICARNCPTCNITMESGKPAWGNNCALCLSCYHKCPQHAVAYGTATADKGQYTYPDSLSK